MHAHDHCFCLHFSYDDKYARPFYFGSRLKLPVSVQASGERLSFLVCTLASGGIASALLPLLWGPTPLTALSIVCVTLGSRDNCIVLGDQYRRRATWQRPSRHTRNHAERHGSRAFRGRRLQDTCPRSRHRRCLPGPCWYPARQW